MSASARHKVRAALKALARWLRKRATSEETAVRIAVEIDELTELRRKAGVSRATMCSGGEQLEYDDGLWTARGGKRSSAPW